MGINLKLIIRNLFRGKIHTLLNITGLSVGFVCAFAVIVWVRNELSFDRHLPDHDRIYRLTFATDISGVRSHFARCWEDWVWQMPDRFPQIEEMVRLDPYRHTAVKIGENKFYSDRVFATDSNFFKVFNIKLIFGNTDQALRGPYSAVISESLSRRYFGTSDPVGKTILFSGEYDTKMGLYNIKGVMKDSPENSHIHFDILTSFVKPADPPAWAYVYILLRRNTGPEDILTAFPAFLKERVDENYQKSFTPYLQKITDIHLYSDKDREIEPNGSIASLYLFIAIALVLILISWVNYYNLGKAKLFGLQKQIHIQLIAGSNTGLIILQSIAESTLTVLLSFALALAILDASQNPVRIFSGIDLLPNGLADLAGSWQIVILILFISILAGSLPLILNMARERKSLPEFKGRNRKILPGLSSFGLLMTAQFCLSMILMISAITITRQNNFMLSKSMGRMSSDIVVLKNQNWEIRSKYSRFRALAIQSPLIKNFTASMEVPSGETLDAFQVESPGFTGKGEIKTLYVLPVEDNFPGFFSIPLLAGRTFSPFNPERKGEDYILNESAVKKLGWTPEEAIGQPFSIKFDSPDIFYGGTVVGVVKDFNFNTLKQKIKPYVMFQKPIFYLCFLAQIDSSRKEEAISFLKKIWEEELPDYPFQYEYISDIYRSAYSKELLQFKVTGFFSLLAIIIICFGLFSVTSVLLARRTKEIGIRKVNGARVIDVMIMLNSGFIRWIAIAFLISVPVAFYLMTRWLQNFVYRREMTWWIFIVAGGVVFAVTLITVSLQCRRTATRNPVEALRYE